MTLLITISNARKRAFVTKETDNWQQNSTEFAHGPTNALLGTYLISAEHRWSELEILDMGDSKMCTDAFLGRFALVTSLSLRHAWKRDQNTFV